MEEMNDLDNSAEAGFCNSRANEESSTVTVELSHFLKL
jgi:hypothetical protein